MIYPTLSELCSKLRDATIRNAPAAQNPLDLNVNMDLDSVINKSHKTPTHATTERQEAKLRLIYASYCPTDGVTLYNLRDSIKEVLSERKEHQSESLSNQLFVTSNAISIAMDAIN